MDGDASSTAADEMPLADPDPELPQPNAWPPPLGPSENDAAVVRMFARLYGGRGLVLSRMPLGGRNTGHSAIIFESTARDGDGGGDPRHVDVDADADADAGADGDDAAAADAYDGFSFGAVPASGVAIVCLPETTVGECEARASGQCAVCLDEYEAGDALRTMPCAHGFHERCIFEWLRASRLCPLCRFALPAEEGAEAADDDVEVEEHEGEADDDALEFWSTYDDSF